MSTDTLHRGDYDADQYEALTTLEKPAPAFAEALRDATAATLVRALDYAYAEFLDDVTVCQPIQEMLEACHGFTPDDIQLVAEGLNPASPAARAALGLPALSAAPDNQRLSPPAIAESGDATPSLSPMETTTATAPAITLRHAIELPDHPLLAHIPVWKAHEPEFQSLKASIIERGVDYPVLIDSAGRVVDGRNRRNACAAAGLEVPTRLVPDDEVIGVILSALGNRRHVTKGAMAYLLAPLLQPAVEEARARQAAALKRGESPSSTQWTTGKTTVESLADGFGFGRATFFQALDLHKKFAANPELKTQFEEGILTGELGLGGAIQAIAGKLSTEGKARNVNPPEKLLFRAVTDLRNRFESWKTMPDDKRAEVTAQFVAAAPEWPADLAVAQAKAWRAAGLIS